MVLVAPGFRNNSGRSAGVPAKKMKVHISVVYCCVTNHPQNSVA